MKYTLIICGTIFACAYARVANPPGTKPLENKWSKRVARDTTWDKPIGDGKIFGTLGQNDDGLFGKGGYKQELFKGDQGKVDGQLYGSRVLGPAGDSSHLGGRLDWSNQDAKAAVDLSKQIGGKTSLKATGEGVWNFDKNTRLSAGGSVEVGKGKPDVGFQGKFQHDF